MFTQTMVFWDWPLHPDRPTIREFAPVGPFRVMQIAEVWRVTDVRKLNKNGLPMPGRTFDSRAEAEAFVAAGMDGAS